MKKITNEISASTKKSLITRIITAIVLAAVCIPCVIFGSWYFFALTVLITIASAYEIVRASNLKGLLKILLYFITILFAVGVVYYCMFSVNREEIKQLGFEALKNKDFLVNSFSNINLSIMVITFMIAVYFVISFACEPFSIAYVFYFATMIIVIAIGVQSLLFLRYSPFYFFQYEISKTPTRAIITLGQDFKYVQSTFLLVYVVIGVVMNDTGAYFVGLLFGKHKMNERISPKKTWEGFIGGTVFSIVFSTTFALVCAALEYPILPIFDLTHLYFIIIISILLPLIADVGDFVFSSIKRNFGIKDFSQLLPGHGGVLDRIDSLLFSAALVSCLIIFIYLINEPQALLTK